MAKVSEYVMVNDSEGIKSAYFDVVRGKTQNATLKIKCSAFLVYLANYDIQRTEDTKRELYEAFNEITSECHSAEDFEYVDGFLAQVSLVGEVGNEFYQSVRQQISAQNTVFSASDEPVSKVIKKDGKVVGVNSRYFENDYRPRNAALSAECAKFLTSMAVYDLRRNSETFTMLLNSFNCALAKCVTEEDYNELRTFLADTAQLGYAAESFYNAVKNELNKEVKQEVVPEPTTPEEGQNLVDNFNSEYESCIEVIASLDFDSVDADVLEALKAQFQSLQQQLSSLGDFMPVEEAQEYARQINEMNGNIETLLQSIPKLIA